MNKNSCIVDKEPELKSPNSTPNIRRKNESSQSMNSPVDSILFLQRTIGNQAVGRLMKFGALQAKLRIGVPDDVYEQEADIVAEQVMRMTCDPGDEECRGNRKDEKDKEILRKPLEDINQIQRDSESSPDVAQEIEQNINSSKNGGQPLPEYVRSFFEPRFDMDFSQVRIHNDSNAGDLNRTLRSRAFTTGKDIFFSEGAYSPETSGGAKLLAHELTHVQQQSTFLQRQNSNASVNEKEINISDELLEIPASEESPVVEAPLPDEMMLPATDNLETNEPYLVIQRKPLLIQRDDVAPAAVVRKDLVFIMGTSGGFYIAAKKFFSQHHPEAEIVDFKDRSLGGIFKVLRTAVSNTAPAGNIYIVSHANQDGTLSFPLSSKDKDRIITFGELRVALKENAEMFKLNGGIDDKSFIHIKGCNIGRNAEMLNALDEAFGGKDKVDAPTHKQGYEFHSKKVNGKSAVVSSEYFNTLILEYPGSVAKDTDTLVSDFKDKYDQFGYKDHEWQMMVMGVKKYNALIGKQGKDKKAEIDKEAKSKKKDVDKADKAALKAIDADTKAAKAKVDAWMKEMKTSKVANKSPGVSKKIDRKFTANLYDNVDPSIDPSKALPLAGMLLGKIVPKGFTVTKCTSISANEDDPLKFDFEFLAENKKTKESMTLTYTTPKFPESDDDGSTIANELLEETIGKKPESEVARKDMYSWRIERKKGKNTIKITAFFEMTQYTIATNLKEDMGDVIDPAEKEGDDFYYGSSDFE